MDSVVTNSKLDFLNQIMQNESDHNTSRSDEDNLSKNFHGSQNETTQEITKITEESYNEEEEEEDEEDEGEEEEEEEEENDDERSQASNESTETDQHSNLSVNENNEGLKNVQTVNLHHHVSQKPTKKEKLAKKQLKPTSSNQLTNLKGFLSSNETQLYSIQTQVFSQFETLLFDLIGLPATSAFKPSPPKQEESNDAVVLAKLNTINHENSTCLVSDLNILNDSFQTNVFRQVKLKASEPKLEKTRAHRNLSAKTNEKKHLEIEVHKKFKNKLITVVLNQYNLEVGCKRRACRLLLTKKNTSNFDVVLNEMSNLFKLETSNIRRLYSLEGNQVRIEFPNDSIQNYRTFKI